MRMKPMPAAVVLSAALLPALPAMAATPSHTAAECEVWQRELSFAKSLADHDAEAFASHIAEQAAFGASQPAPDRGREAIAKGWAPLIEGKGVRLRWYPTRVTIAGRDDIAWSSGPALFEMLNPKAPYRWHVSQFRSVWVREPDGVWRVLFDDGTEPRPATDEDVRAFESGRSECTASNG